MADLLEAALAGRHALSVHLAEGRCRRQPDRRHGRRIAHRCVAGAGRARLLTGSYYSQTCRSGRPVRCLHSLPLCSSSPWAGGKMGQSVRMGAVRHEPACNISSLYLALVAWQAGAIAGLSLHHAGNRRCCSAGFPRVGHSCRWSASSACRLWADGAMRCWRWWPCSPASVSSCRRIHWMALIVRPGSLPGCSSSGSPADPGGPTARQCRVGLLIPLIVFGRAHARRCGK
jgi:hypothetical protein